MEERTPYGEQSDTPRTDAWCRANQKRETYRDIDALARQLERELAQARKDAERYRWLTYDHPDADVRFQVRLIAGSMAISGKGYTDAAIDATMSPPSNSP